MPALPQIASHEFDANRNYFKNTDTSLTSLTMTDNGTNYKTIASGATATVVSTKAGRLAQVFVTATGTGTSAVYFYDQTAGTGSSPILAVPGNSSVSATPYVVNIPVANGITVGGVTNGPALNVIYN